MDFVSDQLFNGKWFRTLTVIDVFTRECLCTHIGRSIKDTDVVQALERLCIHLKQYVFKISYITNELWNTTSPWTTFDILQTIVKIS